MSMQEVGLEPTRVSPRDPKSQLAQVEASGRRCDAPASGGLRGAMPHAQVRSVVGRWYRTLHTAVRDAWVAYWSATGADTDSLWARACHDGTIDRCPAIVLSRLV